MKSYYYFLLLLLVSGNLKAQTALTVGEVYDFNVGDEFHYHHSEHRSYPYNFSDAYQKAIVVLAKNYSANFDTIFYTYQNTDWNYSPYQNLVVYKIDTTHQFVTGLGNPQITGGPITYSMGYNGRVVNNKTNNYSWFEPEYGCDWTEHYSESCVEGCGYYLNVENYCNGSQMSYLHEHLEYFKKGEETWGTAVGIMPNEPMGMGSSIVYPNPATTQLHITSTIPATFVLSNLLWQVVEQASLGGGTVQVSVLGLPAGTYFYQIINPQNQTLQYGKVSIVR